VLAAAAAEVLHEEVSHLQPTHGDTIVLLGRQYMPSWRQLSRHTINAKLLADAPFADKYRLAPRHVDRPTADAQAFRAFAGNFKPPADDPTRLPHACCKQHRLSCADPSSKIVRCSFTTYSAFF
jgi:hypothetical protein